MLAQGLRVGRQGLRRPFLQVACVQGMHACQGLNSEHAVRAWMRSEHALRGNEGSVLVGWG